MKFLKNNFPEKQKFQRVCHYSFLIIIILVIILLLGLIGGKLCFFESDKNQNISISEVIKNSKSAYLKNSSSTKKSQLLAQLEINGLKVWDYFPLENPIVIEDFDEYGFFEVLEKQDPKKLKLSLINTDEIEGFYQLEFLETDKKLQLLINPQNYKIVQIDIFDSNNKDGVFSHKFSQQWQ